MKRIWSKLLPPKYNYEVDSKEWMQNIESYWKSNDNYEVMSCFLLTKWGKIEHVCIYNTYNADISSQTIRHILQELFGFERTAINIIDEKSLLDKDVVQLWLLPQNTRLSNVIDEINENRFYMISQEKQLDVYEFMNHLAEMLHIV